MIEACLVSILGREQVPVGAGLLIEPDLVLTCAHVVNRATDAAIDGVIPPEKSLFLKPHLPSNCEAVEASLAEGPDAWQPPPVTNAGGDLCLLRLKSPVSQNLLPKLEIFADPFGQQYRCLGYPEDWAGDVDASIGQIVGSDSRGLYILRPEHFGEIKKKIFKGEQRPSGVIHRGFSGAPVESRNAIIGLVVQARDPLDITGYLIPASRFPSRFENRFEEYPNTVWKDFPHVRKLRERKDKMVRARKGMFDLRARICENFEGVINAYRKLPSPSLDEGKYLEKIDLKPAALAERLKIGKAYNGTLLEMPFILHAPGGGGKTSYLYDLCISATDYGMVPFFLDFSKKPVHGITEAPDGREQLREWFSQNGAIGDSKILLELSEHADEHKPLLIIDAFNQATRSFIDVLGAIERMSSTILAGATIVIADRMVDRRQGMEGFLRLVIPPLVREAFEDTLHEYGLESIIGRQEWTPILASPLFLGLLLTIPGGGPGGASAIPSRFQVLRQYFEESCEIKKNELQALADFAFCMYDRYRQTAIPLRELETFYSDQEDSFKQKIEDKELIWPRGDDTVEFRHQMLHDWAAALKIASSTEKDDEKLLRAPAFNAISLDYASYEPIEFVVEALRFPENLLQARKTPLQVQDFLSEVFDWNYWITFQCVASLDRRKLPALPRWFCHAIYTHNVEKRFDVFLHSALHAERLKVEIPPSADLTYLEAKSHREINEALRAIFEKEGIWDRSDEYYREWRDIYWRDTDARPVERSDLALLWKGPFLSWTAANAMVRGGLDREVSAEVVRLYEISRATSDSAPRAAMFRWRLVFILSKAEGDVLDILHNIVFDISEDREVRYGAVRSLLELAATRRDNATLTAVLTKIQGRMPELFGHGDLVVLHRLRQELRRVCAFNEPYISGRANWLRDWLTAGLGCFGQILVAGKEMAAAAGLEDEKGHWSEWQQAVEEIGRSGGGWDDRRQIWKKVIERDQ